MNAILNRIKGDKVIWFVVLMLALVSMLEVYSSTRSLAYKMDKHATYYLSKQIMVLFVGLGIIYVVHRVNYKKLYRLSEIAYFLSLPLLLYTMFFGTTINGGTRWITLPIVHLTFQASDFAKLALFLYLARLLSNKQSAIQEWRRGFLLVLTPVLATCALIAPENLSTALLLGATCCILFYIGRVQVKHIATLAGAGVVGAVMLFLVCKATGIGRAETWEKRISDFVGSAPAEGGVKKEEVFQVLQAKIAIANGGLTGLGPGHSRQRDYLPEAYSDFIFSSIIEEYGLLGASILIVLYLTFLWRSILIFRRCPYAFGAFLAVGVSITLVFQAMLNMAVNVGLMPVTGLTLPMVSMGGSSIWFTSIAIGIVLSVSRYVDENEEARKKAASLSPILPDTGNATDIPADLPEPGTTNQPQAPKVPTSQKRKVALQDAMA